MAGAITEEDKTFVEEWEKIVNPQYTILRHDVRGDLKAEVINTKKTFHITTAERKITQDRILKVEDDPFLNGAFRPITVPDSVNIESNPNALSNDEILRILKASPVAWAEWMKVIDSPETLSRMLDLAESDEVKDVLPLSRYKELGARLTDTRPKTQIRMKDRDQFESLRS